MLAQARRVLLHEDYLTTRLYSSERVFDQYQDVKALDLRGINIEIRSCTSAPWSITGALVPAGFDLCRCFFFVTMKESQPMGALTS